jgi:hypothetical protein
MSTRILVAVAIFLIAGVTVWASAGSSTGAQIAFSQAFNSFGSGGGNLVPLW